MKDKFLLLLAGLLLAFVSWAFWRFLGEDAFSVLSTVILLAVVVDNMRLRRMLRRDQQR